MYDTLLDEWAIDRHSPGSGEMHFGSEFAGIFVQKLYHHHRPSTEEKQPP